MLSLVCESILRLDLLVSTKTKVWGSEDILIFSKILPYFMPVSRSGRSLGLGCHVIQKIGIILAFFSLPINARFWFLSWKEHFVTEIPSLSILKRENKNIPAAFETKHLSCSFFFPRTQDLPETTIFFPF